MIDMTDKQHTAQKKINSHIWGNKASPDWLSCNVCGYVRSDKNKYDPCRGMVKIELRDIEKPESTEPVTVMPDGSVKQTKSEPMKTADATMIYLATLGVFRSDITEDELQVVCDAINSTVGREACGAQALVGTPDHSSHEPCSSVFNDEATPRVDIITPMKTAEEWTLEIIKRPDYNHYNVMVDFIRSVQQDAIRATEGR